MKRMSAIKAASDFYRRITTPVGDMGLLGNGAELCALELHPQQLRRDEDALLLRAERELAEYFAGRRRSFSVPLCIRGTPFQLLVWRALADIPYGQAETYGSIARRIGRESACRAVGMACNQNPLPILLPCHRVLGAGNRLTGYAGGLEMKKYLLELEREHMEREHPERE